LDVFSLFDKKTDLLSRHLLRLLQPAKVISVQELSPYPPLEEQMNPQ
jgi:hypothetical protein